MKRLLLATCFVVTSQITYSQSHIGLKPLWSFGSFGDDLGKGAMVTRDINKNGRPEIITTGTSGGYNFDTWGNFSVIEFDPGTNTYATKWISRTYFNEILSLEVMDLNNDGTDEIYLGLSGGEIKVINSSTYEEINSFYAGKVSNFPFERHGVTSMAMGDIDNNGAVDFVATNGDTTYVYSTSFSLQKKFRNINGGTVVLANVDQDNFTEAIYSGGRVMEYNGVTSNTEFRFYPYNNGRNSRIRIADMNSDGIKDVLYSSRDTVHMCNITTKQRFRATRISNDYGTVTDFQVYDYTKDGIPDVFMGNEQFDVLFVCNGLTTAFEFYLQDNKRNGLEALQIADLDLSPGPELIWTSGADCSCSDHFFVYDMNTQEQKWQSKFLENDFAAFDFGNIDADPNDELVVGSFGYDEDYTDHEFLSRFDLKSKSIERDTFNLFHNNFIDDVTAIRIADIDNDGKNEILMGIDYSYSFTMVYVLDQNFKYLRQFQVYGMDIVTDIAVVDVDGDQENEVIVTSGTFVSGSTNPEEWQNYIYVFDGKTGAIEWQSEMLAGIGSRIGNIVVANIDQDPALEIMALLYTSWRNPNNSTLFVIDGWTHEIKHYTELVVNAFAVDDFDQDGIQDIVAGTKDGDMVVIDGTSLEVKKELGSGLGEVSALKAIDQDGDGVSEYVLSTYFQLMVFDPLKGRVTAKSDTLSGFTGAFGSMRVTGTTKEDMQIIINASHALYSFAIKDVANIGPTDFTLLYPINTAELPLTTEWVEFTWQPSVNADDDPIQYSIHITGPGVDTITTQINQTHILFNANLFKGEQTYTWMVTATDSFEDIPSTPFSFKRTGTASVTSIDQSTENSIGVYPNPFKGNFTVHNASSNSLNQLIITDMRGSTLLTANILIEPHDEEVIEEADRLPEGIYICRFISNGATVHTAKINKY